MILLIFKRNSPFLAIKMKKEQKMVAAFLFLL